MIAISSSPWKLACFDLDGTLVRASTGIHLANQIGHGAAMRQLEDDFLAGRVTNVDVAHFDGLHYKGLNPSDVARMLDDIPVIADIGKTVGWLRARGIPSVICTLAWQCVGEVIADRFGFIGSSGPVLKTDAPGCFTGEVETHFTEHDKPVYVRVLCQSLGIQLSEVFHVGDSVSDIPLFRVAGYSVALNANSQARETARVAIDSESLYAVLKLVPGLDRGADRQI